MTDERVLVLLPTTRDGALTRSALTSAGLTCMVCKDLDEFCREVSQGAGVALLTEEFVVSERATCLWETLQKQPPWSDFPLVVLAREGAREGGRQLRESTNATLVERPVKMRSLLSVLKAALRSRRHQYSVRDHLEERKRQTDSLRESEERFRLMADAVPVLVWLSDRTKGCTWFNKSWLDFTGRPMHELLGDGWAADVHPDDLDRCLEGYITHFDARRPFEMEYRLRRHDGEYRWVEDNGVPRFDGNGAFAGYIGSCVDFTDRKRAEEERTRLAAIVESSDDAIVSKTLEGIIMSWNRGAERLFGYTPREAIGQPITLIIPPERMEEERRILGCLRDGMRMEPFETVRLAKNGRRIDISLAVSPVRNAAGQVVGASKVARDITERKHAENSLREADRKKDEFIALLAHELRNPLAPIRNGLQVMRLAREDAKAIAQDRDMMDRQLSHMVRLVDDLLDVSRINQSKMELRRSRVLLTDVVMSAVETAQPMIDAKRLELTISLPQMPVYLDADLTRLAQVFSNLLTNSVKFTETGGRIWLSAERRGDGVEVTVRDTGIGIPRESLGNIFDMFSQVDRSVERSTGGLGIGLALVKGLVEMHGGTVAAASDGPGQGSTFTVTLPIQTTRTELLGTSAPENGDVASRSSRRTLVTDDNRDGADSLAMLLRLLGNEVRIANDGASAVEQAEAFRPEVILMDIGMPRLNGLDATRRIREQPWGREMIIIALTGWGQDGDREKSRDAGCNGHLVKPVSLADLEKVFADAERA